MDDNDWASAPPRVDDLGGTDGWVDPGVREAPQSPIVPAQDTRNSRHQPPRPPPGHVATAESEKMIASGKTFAALSHASILFGLPMFLIPMMQRDNEFALHHGKAAAVNFGLMLFFAAMTFLSCGLFFPLLLLCYIPAIVGIVQASSGQLAGRWAFGKLGERVFGTIRVENPRELEG